MNKFFLAWMVLGLSLNAQTALGTDGFNGVTPPDDSIIVAADGTGQFKTVQQAVDSIPKDNAQPRIVYIKPGTYHEKLRITQPLVHLVGQDAEKTVLTFDDYAAKPGPDGKKLGTFGSFSVTIRAPGFAADNITFENPSAPRKVVGQAVALGVDSDRAVFRNCRFLGNQDTLYANSGRQYYYKCLIRGDVDFIFGNATAVFDQCEIQSTGKGYLTAQSRTDDQQSTGYVFVDCKLTAADAVPEASVYLGRPWRPYARVVYLHCQLGAQIRPQGWLKWRPTDTDMHAFYAEYACTGPGAATDERVDWSKQLAQSEAQALSKENFLKGDDGWAPWKENPPTTAPAAMIRYPARQFSSRLPLDVYVRVGHFDRERKVGTTPTDNPLEIPACEEWWVFPARAPLADVVKEVKAQAIPGLKLRSATVHDLALLKGLTGLQALDLSFAKVTDAGLQQLKDLTGLQKLNLGWCKQVTDTGLQQLKGLTRMQNLDLSGTKVTDAGLEQLTGLTRLEELHLSQTQVGDAGLEQLKGLTGLHVLDLAYSKVTAAGLERLKDLTTLQRLDLGYTHITDVGLEQLKELTGLQALDLSGTKVTDVGLDLLKGLAELKELDVGDTQVTDAGLKQIKGLTGLQKLNLLGTQVTDAGLEQVKSLTGLQELNLWGTQVTDAGLQQLKGLTGLQTLNLYRTKVTDAGLEQLKGLTSLRELDLTGTQVTDAGLEQLKGLTGLQGLHLMNTQVTDAGLEQLKGLTGLQRLDLRDTRVTDAGVAALQKAIPRIQIYR